MSAAASALVRPKRAMSKRHSFGGIFASARQFYQNAARIKAAEAALGDFERKLRASASLTDAHTLKLCGLTLATFVGSHWLADQASKCKWLSPYGGRLDDLVLSFRPLLRSSFPPCQRVPANNIMNQAWGVLLNTAALRSFRSFCCNSCPLLAKIAYSASVSEMTAVEISATSGSSTATYATSKH